MQAGIHRGKSVCRTTLFLEATQSVFYIFSLQCTVATSLLVIRLEMCLQIEYLSAWGACQILRLSV